MPVYLGIAAETLNNDTVVMLGREKQYNLYTFIHVVHVVCSDVHALQTTFLLSKLSF